MSSETTGEHGQATETEPGQLGVAATWRHLPRPAKALLAGILVNRLAGFLQIFLVLFLIHRGYSAAQAGFALGAYGAGGIIGTFAGGWLSDRLTARSVTLISMGGSALLIASIIYVRIYPLILVAVIGVSTVGLLYRPAAQSLITELTPPGQLIMVMAMYRMCLNLGTTAAPLIGVALASVSYNLLFWAEALGALAYGLIALMVLPREGRRSTQAAHPAEADTGERKARGGYLALLADKRYLVFLGAFLLVVTVYSQYTAVLPLAIVREGLSIWWYGAVVTMNAAIVVAFEVLATKFVQRWPLRLTQLTGWGLLALGYGIYAINLIPPLLVLGTLAWTASEIIGAPTTWAYPGLVAPPRLRGRYFGAMQTMFGLGATIGPILGVLLFDHVGHWVWLWAFLLAAFATVVGPLGMRPVSKTAPASAAESEREPARTEPEPAG